MIRRISNHGLSADGSRCLGTWPVCRLVSPRTMCCSPRWGSAAAVSPTQLGNGRAGARGCPGPSNLEGTSAGWVCGRPGIWPWIERDGGGSLRAVAVQVYRRREEECSALRVISNIVIILNVWMKMQELSYLIIPLIIIL